MFLMPERLWLAKGRNLVSCLFAILLLYTTKFHSRIIDSRPIFPAFTCTFYAAEMSFILANDLTSAFRRKSSSRLGVISAQCVSDKRFSYQPGSFYSNVNDADKERTIALFCLVPGVCPQLKGLFGLSKNILIFPIEENVLKTVTKFYNLPKLHCG